MSDTSTNQAAISSLAPQNILHQKVSAVLVTQMIAVVARLGIADLLKDGPLTAAEIADRLDISADAVYRVLRVLAAEGIFEEDGHERFHLTPVGDFLRDDVPGSLRLWAMLHGSDWYWNAVGESMYSLETGEPSFPHVHGTDTFDYFNRYEEHGQLFYGTMTQLTKELLPVLLEQYDFSPFKKVVDVGAGHGSLLAAVLNRYPEIEGTVFDLPVVLDHAKAFVAREGVAEQCEFVGGDFFESVPGGDAYLLKFIIHDWNDEQSRTILRNCRQGITDNGKVLLIENVLGPRNQPCPGKLMDLNMLLMEGGRERSEEEFASLFSESGFRLNRVVPLLGAMCVIEGVPI